MKKATTTPPPARHIVLEMSATRNRHVGVGEVCHQLALQFAAEAPRLRETYGIEFCFIAPKGLKGAYGDDVRYLSLGGFPRRQLLKFRPGRIDLFHALHQFAAVKYMACARHNLLTVHDINFMVEKEGKALARYIRRFRGKFRRTDHLAFISRFAREDTERHFDLGGRPVRVVYNGVTDLGDRPPVDLDRHNLPANYLFHISSLLPKKNPALLIEMMRHLPDRHLVLAGNWRTEYAATLTARIEALGLTNITPLHHVTDEEKAALYAGCKGFLFPSLCEGFGLPPLEAMRMGKPAFLSTLTSLPEVGGPHAYYWPELEPEAMARRVEDGLRDFYADPQKAADARTWAGQFSWEKCAREYIDYYLDILGLT